jgi:hypothetical protein
MRRTKSQAPLKLTAEKQEPRQTKASAEHGLASKNQYRNNSVARNTAWPVKTNTETIQWQNRGEQQESRMSIRIQT